MIATVHIGTRVEVPPVVVSAVHHDPFVTLTINTHDICLTRDEARRIGDALRACSLTVDVEGFGEQP